MPRFHIFLLALLGSAMAIAQTPPPSDVALPSENPASAAPGAAAPTQEAAAAEAPKDEQELFEQYRHDLINLLALRAEPDLLIAATELAYPDSDDKKRPAALKPPALLKRAQKFGAESPLVWWVSTFFECPPKTATCANASALKLQQIDGDNLAVWMPSLHSEKDPGKARALLTSMAQAHRFDDYWSSGVLAIYSALQTLPVPPEVIGHGLNATAARLNFATSVGGGFLPNFERLGEMCRPGDTQDDALVADCLAIARMLETGGTFRSQAVGFAIESTLLPPGTARDVLRVRQRAAAWQKEKFVEISTRFPREEALAQNYADLLRANGNELATVGALLRSEHLMTDPPAGWQPPDVTRDPLSDPMQPQPGH